MGKKKKQEEVMAKKFGPKMDGIGKGKGKGKGTRGGC